MSWSDTILQTLKDNDVRLVAYVPDNVLTPLIKVSPPTTISWRWARRARTKRSASSRAPGLGGIKGCVMMQTSGFAVAPNALASLIVPFQIPAVMIISERGTLGEFNSGQALVARTMRPVLDSVAVTHHTLTDQRTLRLMVDKSIKQAVATQAPVALILSPLLTGGNPVAEEKLRG